MNISDIETKVYKYIEESDSGRFKGPSLENISSVLRVHLSLEAQCLIGGLP